MKTPFLTHCKERDLQCALPYFDPTSETDIAALLALSDDDSDLSELSLETLNSENSHLLKTRILVDKAPSHLDAFFEKKDFSCLEDLIRMGVDWDHDNFDNLPDELRIWMDFDSPRVQCLREDELWEGMSDLLMCAVDPRQFSHLLMAGEANLDWVQNDTLFLDLLCRLGGTSWIPTLAILCDNKKAFRVAGELALFASSAFSLAENSNDFYYKIASGEITHDLAFSLIYALFETEEEQLPYLQAAAHEILIRRGAKAPAIDGAPFSGEEYSEWDLEEGAKIMGEEPTTPAEHVRRAKLMSDLIHSDFDESDTFDLRGEESEYVQLALEPERFSSYLASDCILGMVALDLWAKGTSRQRIEALEKCSLFRADFLREQIALYTFA